MNAEEILTALIEVWCDQYGQKLEKLNIEETGEKCGTKKIY